MARHIVHKGAIAGSDASGTVNAVVGACLGFNVVPHITAQTIMEGVQAGILANL